MSGSPSDADNTLPNCPFADADFGDCGGKIGDGDKICEGCQGMHPYWLVRGIWWGKEEESSPEKEMKKSQLLSLVQNRVRQKAKAASKSKEYLCFSEKVVVNNPSEPPQFDFTPDLMVCEDVESPIKFCKRCTQKAQSTDWFHEKCFEDGTIKQKCVLSDPQYADLPFRTKFQSSGNCVPTRVEGSVCNACLSVYNFKSDWDEDLGKVNPDAQFKEAVFAIYFHGDPPRLKQSGLLVDGHGFRGPVPEGVQFKDASTGGF